MEMGDAAFRRAREAFASRQFPARPAIGLNLTRWNGWSVLSSSPPIGLAFFHEYPHQRENGWTTSKSARRPSPRDHSENMRGCSTKPRGHAHAEAYRIWTNIEFQSGKSPEATRSPSSWRSGVRQVTTIANLAFICAQGGYSTLIRCGTCDGRATSVVRSEQ